MASKTGTLYLGVTNNIQRRTEEHRRGVITGFSKTYGCTKLVYVEDYQDVKEAISREKQLKKWSRKKKECLIRQQNPTWGDLGEEL
jgi:putative endonuclease